MWLDTLIADVLATVGDLRLERRAYKNSSFYDAYWSVIPPLLLFYWWYRSAPDVDVLRCWLIATVVVLWAIRLTANWVYGFPGLHHEDWRYPMFKQRAGPLRDPGRPGRHSPDPDAAGLPLAMVPVYVAVTRPGPGTWCGCPMDRLRPWDWPRSRSNLSPMCRCTGLSAADSGGEAMDRGLWSGRGTRTISGSSVSGLRWHCSVLRPPVGRWW